MSETRRTIAEATVLRPIPVEYRVNKADDTPLEESINVEEFTDAEHDVHVVRVEIEHYDGYRSIEFDVPQWRAFRAAIIARGKVAD